MATEDHFTLSLENNGNHVVISSQGKPLLQIEQTVGSELE